MQVSVKLDNWKIRRDSDTKLLVVEGKYVISAMNTVVAKQSFNDQYGEVKIPFSANLVSKIEALEKEILTEIQGMVS